MEGMTVDLARWTLTADALPDVHGTFRCHRAALLFDANDLLLPGTGEIVWRVRERRWNVAETQDECGRRRRTKYS
jgi:hypothetical protein